MSLTRRLYCHFAATLLLAIVALGLQGGRARAQAVNLSCSVSISTVAFGSLDVLPMASVSTNATLSVSCLSVTLSSGSLYVCVALPARSMQGPSTTLAYDIYGPSPLTTSWSNTAQIAVPLSTLKLGQTYTLNVPATVFGSQQTVPPGSYTQTLAATATYGTTNCTSGSLFGSTSFSFQATATVLKSCNVSASNLNFGAVGDLTTIVDGQSALSLQCTQGTGYTVSLNGGLSGATDPTARKMMMGSQSITYGLYQNNARSVPWGTQASATLAGTGTSSSQMIPVYGRVPVQATPGIGTYSDTIVVSVTY